MASQQSVSSVRFTWLKVPRIPGKVGVPTQSSTLGEKRPVSCVSPDVEDQSSTDEDQSSTDQGRKFKVPRIPVQANAARAIAPVQKMYRRPASSVVDDAMLRLMDQALQDCRKPYNPDAMLRLMDDALQDYNGHELYNIYKATPKLEMKMFPVYCLVKAGNFGLPKAQLELAKIYGVASTYDDPDSQRKIWKRKKFWKWLIAAANNGVPEAQYELGMKLVKFGRPIEAAKWFAKAAEQNYPKQGDDSQHLQQVALTLLSLNKSIGTSPSPPLADSGGDSGKPNA